MIIIKADIFVHDSIHNTEKFLKYVKNKRKPTHSPAVLLQQQFCQDKAVQLLSCIRKSSLGEKK